MQNYYLIIYKIKSTLYQILAIIVLLMFFSISLINEQKKDIVQMRRRASSIDYQFIKTYLQLSVSQTRELKLVYEKYLTNLSRDSDDRQKFWHWLTLSEELYLILGDEQRQQLQKIFDR